MILMEQIVLRKFHSNAWLDDTELDFTSFQSSILTLIYLLGP
jgi:hypothetical protein